MRGTALTPASVVRLAPGFRLQWEQAQQAHVLLYPEGMVTLNDTAAEILKRCTGCTQVELLADLRNDYPDADLEADVIEFLGIAHEQGWLRIS